MKDLTPQKVLNPEVYSLLIFNDSYKITKPIDVLKQEMNLERQKHNEKTWNYETFGWLVVLVNNTIKFQTKKSKFNLLAEIPIDIKLNNLPPGVHVFEKPNFNFNKMKNKFKNLFLLIKNKKLNNLDKLFQNFKFRSRGNNITLFDDDSTRDFTDNLKCIQAYNHELYTFVLGCGNYCMKIMNLPEERLGECQLHILHYYPNGGIGPHIDAVHTHNDTLGPTFVFNMDSGVKMFDMLPTLDSSGTPCRIFTTQGQCTVMDNISRLLWTHAIPLNLKGHRYSLAFKFPEMQRLDVIHSDYFNVDIPVNVM